jgi:hypothetical protein
MMSLFFSPTPVTMVTCIGLPITNIKGLTRSSVKQISHDIIVLKQPLNVEKEKD